MMYEVTATILVHVDGEKGEQQNFNHLNGCVEMEAHMRMTKNDLIINEVLEIERCNRDGCKGCKLNCDDRRE